MSDDSATHRCSVLVIIILCAVGMLSALQFMLVVPLLPVLPTALGVSPSEVQWLITSSVLASAVGTPVFARLADMYGHRKLMQVSLFCIVVGSALGLVSNAFWVLVAARSIAGLSNASVSVSIALMRKHIAPEKRALGIGLAGTSGVFGVGLAIPLGSVLYASFGWQSIFTSMLIASLLLMAAVHATIPRDGVSTGGKFDFIGAALLTVGLLCGLVAVTQGPTWGWLSTRVLVLLGVAVVVGVVWLNYERRLDNALVDLGLSVSRTFVIVNLATLAVGFNVFGNIMVMTSQLQVPSEAGGFGLSTGTITLLVTIPAMVIMVAGPVAGFLVDRIGGRELLFIGGILQIVGYGSRCLFTDQISVVFSGAILVQLASAACMAAVPVIVTANTPLAETAAANGINNLIRSVGNSLASATIAAVFTITAVSASGFIYPERIAFLIFFGIAGLCGIAIAALSRMLPRDRGKSL